MHRNLNGPRPLHNSRTPLYNRSRKNKSSSSLHIKHALGESEQKDSRVAPPPSDCYDHDCSSFTHLLKRFMLPATAILPFQGQCQMSQQDTHTTTKPKPAGADCAINPINLSSLTPADTSVPGSAPAIRKPLSMICNIAPELVMHKQNSRQHTDLPRIIAETPPADGYSWRKYGQKQMKPSKSLRSYYKCGNSNCNAKKKVQQCDQSGRVIDVVYTCHHNHDPPQKKCNRSRGFVSSAKVAGDSRFVDHSFEKPDSSDVSVCFADASKSSLLIPESAQDGSSRCNAYVRIEVQGQSRDELESKQFETGPHQDSSGETASAEVREKHNAESRLEKRTKAIKEPKIDLGATSDVGISSDSYRWRKYGRKMVKGNSFLRSYYRCTSSGCPARKYVESTTNGATTTTVAYQGKHDHDMPASKKRHGTENPLFSSSAAAMNDYHCKKAKSSYSQRSLTKWMDGEADLMGEKLLELGGEKALESAQTLLSIGIELKPC